MSAQSWERRGPLLGSRAAGAGRQVRPGAGAPVARRMPGGTAAIPSPLRRHARHLLSAAVLVAGCYFAAVHARDLRAASHLLAGLRWPWIGAAVLCEATSMLVLARLQRRLLRAGGVRLGLHTMLGMTVAANAMAATLPGGVAWSAAWVFNQLSRHGVPRALRVWMFLAAGAVSSFALFVVVAAGVEIAGGTGPMSSLRTLVLILAAIPVMAAACQLLRRVPRVRHGCDAAGRRLAARSVLARRLQRVLGTFASRLTAVRLSPGGWADALAMGLANWLLDAAVLIAVLQALAIHVPWHAILVIYGVTQVAGSLPVTPGGLGVVEGSLAGLLAAYGTGGGQALAAVMAYRLVSFWVMVPAGWLVWLHLSFWRPGRVSARAGNARRETVAGMPARPAGSLVSPAGARPARTSWWGRATAWPPGCRPVTPGRGRPRLAGATMSALFGAALPAQPGTGGWRWSTASMAFEPAAARPPPGACLRQVT